MVAGQRDLMGQGMFMVLMSYKVHTCACLLALSLVLALPGSTTIAVIPRVEGDKRSDDSAARKRLRLERGSKVHNPSEKEAFAA